jgi:hypothetical protein
MRHWHGWPFVPSRSWRQRPRSSRRKAITANQAVTSPRPSTRSIHQRISHSGMLSCSQARNANMPIPWARRAAGGPKAEPAADAGPAARRSAPP